MRELLNSARPETRTLPPGVRAAPAGVGPAPAGAGTGATATGTQAAGLRPPHRSPAPMVERIACWSARHRIAVIAGWLVLAAAALLAGRMLGTQSQPQYDPGQAGQAEQMLHQLHVVTPPAERVLIRARGGGPDATYARNPAMRSAVADVVRDLQRRPRAAQDIRSPL